MSIPASTNKRIVVAMSGGVDSSVTALLLKQQGFEVEGMFMKNWEEDDTENFCSAAKDRADAQAVCDKIGIELTTVNFAEEYWQNVFEHFLTEYRALRTPNPDILCNREIKFKVFLQHALARGASHMATGHYARIIERDGKFHLHKGLDANKDQSYFLYTLNQAQLQHSLFPIGDLEKSAVRMLAKQHALPTHAKKDSTGICFIGEKRFTAFLQQYLPKKRGPIKTPEGKTLGEHHGLAFYTLGQRQGLGIGGVANSKESPWYVIAKNHEQNTLYVAQDHLHPWLMAKTASCGEIHWISDVPLSFPFSCRAKTRYRQADQDCVIHHVADLQYRVEFSEAQRAVTPGQSLVFYRQEQCLGGAVIESSK